MLGPLIQIIPSVSTGLILIAFVCAIIACAYFQRMRTSVRLVNSILKGKRFDALKALISHFDVDTSNLTKRQKFSLAAAQIRLRRLDHCKSVFLGTLISLLMAIIVLYAIQKTSSGPLQVEANVSDINSDRATPDSVVGSDKFRDSARLPYAIRFLNPQNFQEQLANDGQVTVANSRSSIPNRAEKDGEFFLIPTKEGDSTVVHVAASFEKYRVERTLVISGYTANQVPCDRRTIYLAEQPIPVTARALGVATESLNDTSHCASIDKALIIWDSLESAQLVPLERFTSATKNTRTLITYNWARGNYQACVALGYEQQCEISKAAFESFDKTSLKQIGINDRDVATRDLDVRAIPLRISYSKVQEMFSIRDYLSSAKLAEKLIDGFERNSKFWEHIKIPKSRLYADAAVSWLHYGDSLASSSDAGERRSRCTSYQQALADAQHVQWYDFRQEHVPLMEARAAGCQ